jgi:rhomboid protease GluP
MNFRQGRGIHMLTRNENFQPFYLYPVVSMICFIQVFIWFLLQIPHPFFTLLFAFLSGYNAGIQAGEWWRLLTPIFLHTNFSHLFFNTISFILFAPPLERILTSWKFTIVYFVCGIFANIATFVLEPENYVHVGASGAIFGLFGIYVFMALYRKEQMDKRNVRLILTIIAIGIITTLFSSNTNVVAHLSGLLIGFLIAPILIKKKVHFHHYSFYETPQKGLKTIFYRKEFLGFFIVILALIVLLILF